MNNNKQFNDYIEMMHKRMKSIDLTLNDRGNIIGATFTDNNGWSYIDVIEKPGSFKLLCHGAYDTYVFGRNWNGYYIDYIDPENFYYNASKLEAGKAKRFNECKLKEDMKEFVNDYVSELDESDDKYIKAQEALDEFLIDENTDSKNSYFAPIRKLMEDIDEPDWWEDAKDWGMEWDSQFIIWMAIIAIAKEKYKSDLLNKVCNK